MTDRKPSVDLAIHGKAPPNAEKINDLANRIQQAIESDPNVKGVRDAQKKIFDLSKEEWETHSREALARGDDISQFVKLNNVAVRLMNSEERFRKLSEARALREGGFKRAARKISSEVKIDDEIEKMESEFLDRVRPERLAETKTSSKTPSR